MTLACLKLQCRIKRSGARVGSLNFFYERIGIGLAIWFEDGRIDWNENWDFLVDGWATKSLLVRLVDCFFGNQRDNRIRDNRN